MRQREPVTALIGGAALPALPNDVKLHDELAKKATIRTTTLNPNRVNISASDLTVKNILSITVMIQMTDPGAASIRCKPDATTAY